MPNINFNIKVSIWVRVRNIFNARHLAEQIEQACRAAV